MDMAVGLIEAENIFFWSKLTDFDDFLKKNTKKQRKKVKKGHQRPLIMILVALAAYRRVEKARGVITIF